MEPVGGVPSALIAGISPRTNRALERAPCRSLPKKLQLSVALCRVPIQGAFKLRRGWRSFELASQNLAIGCVVSVELPVGIPIRPKRRTSQRDARKQPARTGIGQHFRLQLHVRLSARVAANRTCRHGCISAERKLVG